MKQSERKGRKTGFKKISHTHYDTGVFHQLQLLQYG